MLVENILEVWLKCHDVYYGRAGRAGRAGGGFFNP